MNMLREKFIHKKEIEKVVICLNSWLEYVRFIFLLYFLF